MTIEEFFGNEYDRQPEEVEAGNTTPATQGFICDSLDKCEWAVSKLKGLYSQREAVTEHADAIKAKADAWREAELQKLLPDVSYFESQLRFYAENNPPVKGKTISLIGGKLSMRQGQVKYIYEPDAVIEALELMPNAEAMGSLIRIEKVLAWNVVKSYLEVKEDGVYLGNVKMPIQAELPAVTFKVEIEGGK